MTIDMFGFDQPLPDRALTIDAFAGGGGASTGIGWALGRSVDIAINHDNEALRMHKANHPQAQHVREDIWKVDLDQLVHGRPVAHLHASPDCTHFSKAKGGQPRSPRVRGLAWWVVKAARAWKPALITLENVEEFTTWGPVDDAGQAIADRKGEHFDFWVRAMRKLGYQLEWRTLVACDYGAPTSRKRLFIIARCDGNPIVWPAPTHGPGLEPYRTAAECIDWSIPVPSIFTRKRPLAEATMRRVAHGVDKFVLKAKEPFFVQIGYGERPGQAPRVMSLMEPLTTVVAGGVKHAVVVPHLMNIAHRGWGSKPTGVEEPVPTVVTKAEQAVVTCVVGVGGRRAQSNPTGGDEPLPTTTTKADAGLVMAYMAQHNGGANGNQAIGRGLDEPVSTVTNRGSQQQLVYAFMAKYYGNGGQLSAIDEPMHTITTKDRMACITVNVNGQDYVIDDIGMRMLTPRELYTAQGFPKDYVIDTDAQGHPLTKKKQVHMCGNSVPPQWAEALTRANHPELNDARKPEHGSAARRGAHGLR